MVKKVTEELEAMHPHLATRALKDFWLNDFSRNYIKFVRDRVAKEDAKVKSVIKEVYLGLVKLCAPVIPFLAEKIWQELREKKIVKEESVHLADWPKAEVKRIDERLEYEFSLFLLSTIEKGLAEREKLGTSLKWPLAKVKIKTVFPISEKFRKGFEEIIKSQLNVKDVEIKFAKPKQEKPEDITEKKIGSVVRANLTSVKGYQKDFSNRLSVTFDEKMTPELEAEGYARELSRKIQEFRKQLGLEKKDKVKTFVIVDAEFENILEKQKKFISERTNSKKLEFVTTGKERFKNKTDFKIKDKIGWISIVKL